MTEQQEIITEFEDLQVLAGIRWAFGSAVDRALEDYSEDAGYDSSWLGTTRHTLLRDRLDRVFGCGKYAAGAGSAEVGLDVLHAELPKRDIQSMPAIAPGVVRRSDLVGSPGWAASSKRFLLAAAKPGKIDQLPWPQKSPTKQRVAKQPNPEPPPSLFDEFDDEQIAGLAAAATDDDLDMDTFVVAHTLDSASGLRELVLGRPQLNLGGGQAWVWYENLLGQPPSEGGRLPVEPPAPAGPDSVPDAPVRVRRPAAEGRDGHAGGAA